MLILIKSKIFQHDIRTWNARPTLEHTWDNFQDAFRLAYDSLRDLGDLTMSQSPVLNQSQLIESTMSAMQSAGGQFTEDQEPLQDSTGPLRHTLPPSESPPSLDEQHASNAFESTLLRKFAELTT